MWFLQLKWKISKDSWEYISKREVNSVQHFISLNGRVMGEYLKTIIIYMEDIIRNIAFLLTFCKIKKIILKHIYYSNKIIVR